MSLTKVGKVWLVGAGPGDAGLFTRKGYDVLQQADVVVYDALVGDGVLACVPRGARTIDVGKRAANHTMRQEQISQVLLDEALAGNKVVRLKGGDPFMFGRGGDRSCSAAAVRNSSCLPSTVCRTKWFPASRRHLPCRRTTAFP